MPASFGCLNNITQNVKRPLSAARTKPREFLLRFLIEHPYPHRRFLSVESTSHGPSSIRKSPPTTSPRADLCSDSSSAATDIVLSKVKFPQYVPKPLPNSCPGCGALSQETQPGEAGYYSRSRNAVKTYFRQLRDNDAQEDQKEKDENVVTSDTWDGERKTTHYHPSVTGQDVSTSEHESQSTVKRPNIPICDRCHELLYQSKGVSISHPTIDAIADSIAESPFRTNHIYHVLDAADFPMSLIPSIYKSLGVAKPRGQNRRAQHNYSNKPTISFLITRSDLLAPTKDMVDGLMTYFTSVLRSALGNSAENIRLGNVHLVSAKRGWWTTDIKDSIWQRGGGNWMVGKVNVGKSNLFEVLFPKGSGERAPSYAELEEETHSTDHSTDAWSASYVGSSAILSEDSLLPPPQPESPFPTLPLVSSLPGTTASPIRLPFGKHKGELIDMPGLARGCLEKYVQEEHKLDLVMTHRPNVLQHNIKSGQSLLLGGGLVRITPILDETDESTAVLAYPFVPIDAHVTATQKAIGTQLQLRESGIKSILATGVGDKIASAGVFTLKTDVTKVRAAPILNAGIPMDRLPFRVFSTDLLIEGVGWVELVCQVRQRKKKYLQPSLAPFQHTVNDALSHLDEIKAPTEAETFEYANDFELPQVEVYSPEGKHISERKSMGAWVLLNQARLSKAGRRAKHAARPRKPMKGVKRREKMAKRAALRSQEAPGDPR